MLVPQQSQEMAVALAQAGEEMAEPVALAHQELYLRKELARLDIASGSGTSAEPALDHTQPAHDQVSTRRRTYNTGPGSAFYLMFGDDQQVKNAVPDLNDVPHGDDNGEEIPIS